MAKVVAKLRFVPQSVAHVPFRVLENAFWRPQAAKLSGKHKDSLHAISDVRATKMWQRLWRAWAREETWINHALNALLLSLPDEALSSVMNELTGGGLIKQPHVAKIETAGIAGLVGDPDFIVLGQHACVLGESKVQAHDKSHKYSFGQYTKYMTLGAIIASGVPSQQRETRHLLLVPTADPKVFCSDYKQWQPRVVDRILIVDPDSIEVRDKKQRFRDYETWHSFLGKTLLGMAVQSRCSLDLKAVERVLAGDRPEVVPTYVATWSEMAAAIGSAAKAIGHSSAAEAAATLERLSNGGESFGA